MAGEPGTWTLSVTPAADQVGNTQINLVASDGSLTDQANVSVAITSVNDQPTISSIPPQTINENTSTAALPVTIGDIETSPGSLLLSATSTNSALVPLSNIVFGGGGTNRNVTVTPTAGQFGSTDITVIVRDADTGESQTTFQLTVMEEVNTPPFFVTTVTNQAIDEDFATGPLPFQLGDADTPLTSLTVTAVLQTRR